MRKPRRLLFVCLGWLLAMAPVGCSSLPTQRPGAVHSNGSTSIDPELVQASTASFATRYLVAMADVYNRVPASPEYPRAADMAQAQKLVAGESALGNAVNPNPIVGLMDMALMVTLSGKVMEDPWAAEVYGTANAAMIISVLKAQETDIWNVAGGYLSAEQIKELKALTERWRAEHPDQHSVGGARLADFSEGKKADSNPALALTKSVFGLITLDPFTGLDPAVRQVEESRILAERMFFYTQHMPTLLSWQTEVLFARMLAAPQMAELFSNTSKVTANTTDFAQATGRFADATVHFSGSIETFRTDWPQQQATLVKQVDDLVAKRSEASLAQANADLATQRDATVKQLNDVVAKERDAALKQANAELATLRDATVQQLNDAVAAQRDAAIKQAGGEIAVQRDAALTQLATTMAAQQELMAKNLQGVLDSSLDRLFWRGSWMIVIAGGTLLGVLLLHRHLGRKIAGRKGPQ